jgi:hypothetical protein
MVICINIYSFFQCCVSCFFRYCKFFLVVTDLFLQVRHRFSYWYKNGSLFSTQILDSVCLKALSYLRLERWVIRLLCVYVLCAATLRIFVISLIHHFVISISLYFKYTFFLIRIVGGWNPNWVHSARRPLNGLLYLPRVIMMKENLEEWRLAGETEVLGENLPQCPFVYHKFHLTRPGFQPGPSRWESSD